MKKELRKRTCDTATRRVRSSIAANSLSRSIVNPSSDLTDTTRAPSRFAISEYAYRTDGKSSSVITTVSRSFEKSTRFVLLDPGRDRAGEDTDHASGAVVDVGRVDALEQRGEVGSFDPHSTDATPAQPIVVNLCERRQSAYHERKQAARSSGW